MQLYLMLDLYIFVLIFAIRFDENTILEFLLPDMLVFDQDRAIFHQKLSDNVGSLESDTYIYLVIQGQIC